MSVNRGMKQALVFITTFAIFEAGFTYLLMHFANWFADKQQFLFWLDWVLIFVFLILGINSFRNADKEFKDNEKHRKRDSIRVGIVLGIFNPMQIPFWMIFGTYLISHNWIVAEGWGLEVFALGAAIGAFASLYLFARFAKFLKEKFSLSSRLINRSVGLIFFALIIFQLSKMYFFKA
mgnify:CR=1 FL=1